MVRSILVAIAILTQPMAATAFEIKTLSSPEMSAKATALLAAPPRAVVPAGALPDTEIATGSGHIRKVWLTDPTDRYGHGVLGDAIEAGGIAAELTDGTIARLKLDTRSVFEDRVPRLIDMNGDGGDEILVVRSYLDAGAALSVIEERGGKLTIAAMARPIGIPNRWLNPVGAADFDGDGRMEAAVVITPHIGGTLQLYEWRGDKLIEDHAKHGFSNHAMGSRQLGLSAMADLNGDGVTDIVIPDAGRGELIGLTFAGGTYKEFFRRRLEGRLGSAIMATDLTGNGRAEIIYRAGGDVIVLGITR